jgi:hypothetical protein
LICHAPSTAESRDHLLRAPVPSPSQPLPPVYYSNFRGPIIRADIVYLRQDFSAKHEVANHSPWPKEQRFDYFVRTRPATEKELATAIGKAYDPAREAYRPIVLSEVPPNYPQREAVLYALRRLALEP